ncbi:MAG: polyhydroxyalkanoate synthesis repressor PhaR, partial [Alphaproteobacteria bacterium]
DITRSVLTQIIVEEEAKGHNLLPIGFLRRIIAFYGDSMQSLLAQYLEHSMSAFTSNQERMRRYMEETFGGMFPFGPIETMGKQNVAMMEQAMRMLSPFAPPAGKEPNSGAGETGAGAEKKPAEDRVGDLQARIDALQKQLDELNRTKRG